MACGKVAVAYELYVSVFGCSSFPMSALRQHRIGYRVVSHTTDSLHTTYVAYSTGTVVRNDNSYDNGTLMPPHEQNNAGQNQKF
jgi:hypothetical protein